MVLASPARLLQRLVPAEAAVRRFLLVAGLLTGLLAFVGLRDWKSGGAERRLNEARAAAVPGRTLDYVVVWIPRVATAGAVAGLGIMAAARWLGRPLPLASPSDSTPASPAMRRALTVVTLLVMATSGVMNAPRLDFSLWGDEDATLRKSVLGQFDRGDDDRLKFRSVTWLETFYRYRDPNNHPLNSLLARVSHAAFARDRTAADGFYFDERALRLPVFAAGLLAFPALAWLAWGLRQPAMGMAAIVWLALHPWHVRYGVEARGYGLLLLIAPLCLGCLVRAAQTGKWRWWLGFGAGEFLTLWAYPGSLLMVVAWNVSALLMAWQCLPRPSRMIQCGRWLSVSVLGAVMTALAFAPCVEPLLLYMKTPRMQGPMPGSWYPDAISWLAAGMPWHPWDASSPLCFSWQQWLVKTPWLAWPCFLGAIVTPIAGGVWWWRRGGASRALLPALALFPALLLLQARASGGFFCTWYTLPGLVGWVLLTAGGVCWMATRRPWLALLPIAAFATASAGPAAALREAPIEAMREGTELTRTVRLASHPDIDTAVTAGILMTTRAYDPAVRDMESDDPEILLALMADAARTGRPLHVHLGSPAMARETKPRLMAIIEDPARFALLRVFPGHDAPYERRVYRALPAR